MGTQATTNHIDSIHKDTTCDFLLLVFSRDPFVYLHFIRAEFDIYKM